MMNQKTETIQMLQAFDPLFRPKRLKIYFGGRAAAKSYHIALALLIRGTTERIRVLCTRELQASIEDSVIKLLGDLNEKHGFGYETQKTRLVHHISGTEFRFSGLKANVTKIKSFEGIDVVWIEEAENITEQSWDKLRPTVRKEGSEIWVSFNPADESDYVYRTLVAPYAKKIEEKGYFNSSKRFIRKINYDENIFLSQTMKDEIAEMKRDDYDKYLHVYEGYPTADYEDSMIQPAWFDAAIGAFSVLKVNPGNGMPIYGYDPADGGKDLHAWVMRRGSKVYRIEQRSGTIEEGVRAVYQDAMDHNARHLIFDEIGVGSGARVMLNSLDDSGHIQYQGFKSSRKPTGGKNDSDLLHVDVFKNMKAEIYWNLRERFRKTYHAVKNNEYCDPQFLIHLDKNIENLANLRKELCKIRSFRDTSGRIQIESKEQLAKRGIPSPNLSDALAMAFAPLKEITREAEPLQFNTQW